MENPQNKTVLIEDSGNPGEGISKANKFITPSATGLQSDTFNNLFEDLQAIFVEHEFVARWTIVECYHLVGKRILEDMNNIQGVPSGEIVQRVADGIGKKTRTIWYAIQFARKYPDLNLLPDGKNTSWHAICNKYLPEPAESPIEATINEEVKQDFNSLDAAMQSSLTLQEELEHLDATKFDVSQDAKDYLLSQLRLTASTLNKFLITYDLSQ